MDWYKIQKVQLSQVAKFYWAAALLANCYTCLDHGITSNKYNGCMPPTLHEYFGRDANEIPVYYATSIAGILEVCLD